MKKILLTSTICLFTAAAFASECAYAPEQEIVRSAENFQEISQLGDKFDPNKKYPCGGTLGQLAVLRGNLDTLNYLHAYGADYNAMVSLKGFEIPGAPNEIPFPLFVARYAPNSPIVDVMLNSNVNFQVKDSMGHDALWYFERNPVLRRSYLTKKVLGELIPMTERIERIKKQQQM